jgi:hypothetical protein
LRIVERWGWILKAVVVELPRNRIESGRPINLESVMGVENHLLIDRSNLSQAEIKQFLAGQHEIYRVSQQQLNLITEQSLGNGESTSPVDVRGPELAEIPA